MGNAHQRNHCPHCPYRTTVPCCCTKQLQNAIQGPLANDQGFHTHTRALTQTSMQTEPNKDRQRERDKNDTKQQRYPKLSKVRGGYTESRVEERDSSTGNRNCRFCDVQSSMVRAVTRYRTSPAWSECSMVVFPEPTRPTRRILCSCWCFAVN